MNIIAMIKDGGYKSLKITPDQIGKLAESIHKQGAEWVTLLAGPIQVVGFVVASKQAGDRIIMLGEKDNETNGQV
jgi:hypothetical protein